MIVQIRVKKKKIKKKDGEGEGERAKKRERWLRLCVLVCLMALRLLSAAAAEAEICSRSNQMKLNECFSFTKTSRQTFFFIIIISLTRGLAWLIKNESRLYRSHPVSHC